MNPSEEEIKDIESDAFKTVEPSKQITFSHWLNDIRDQHLRVALKEAITEVGIEKIDEELYQYAGSEKLEFVAQYNLRGELVFPVPSILKAKPSLLGYYRLLYGLSKNQDFYGGDGPFGKFKKMESEGRIIDSWSDKIPALCKSLIETAWKLISDVEEVSEDHIDELVLLTLGAQFSGAHRVFKGQEKTKNVYQVIKNVVEDELVDGDDDEKFITVNNNADREVLIMFSDDPDVRIREKLNSGKFRNLIAIEIKGGEDYSNAHNRLGEAEKSHSKAKSDGYNECWTLINTVEIDDKDIEEETPTTTQYFVISELRDESSDQYEDFRDHLASIISIS